MSGINKSAFSANNAASNAASTAGGNAAASAGGEASKMMEAAKTGDIVQMMKAMGMPDEMIQQAEKWKSMSGNGGGSSSGSSSCGNSGTLDPGMSVE